jgi:hypothetical protein
MIPNWIREQNHEYGLEIPGIGKPFDDHNGYMTLATQDLPAHPVQSSSKTNITKKNMSVQCNGKEIDGEIFHLWNPAKFLYDIAEDEKEVLNTSASSTEMSLSKNTNFNSQISKKAIQEDSFKMKGYNPGRNGLKILSNEKVITNLHRQSKTHVAPTKNKVIFY